jgi:hypothetical protein
MAVLGIANCKFWVEANGLTRWSGKQSKLDRVVEPASFATRGQLSALVADFVAADCFGFGVFPLRSLSQRMGPNDMIDNRH